ncbi:MAG TPA: error-prone DNA polymerase [Gemmatimonadaceae bacterium]|nr:error-prone DNA polymerase [Gemmatimonadaceae bacterium]
MPNANYVELHCHSAYSLLDGASHPDALVARARRLGLPALALTDHDELGGAVAFAQAAADAGLGGIIGAEITVRHDAPPPDADDSHLVLLAESRAGYANLSTIITRARRESTRGQPGVSLDLVAEHAGGLFALTGCPRGWVPRRVARDDLDGARAAAATLRDIFPARLAIECWDHGLEEERRVVPQLMAIARALDIPWVVTNDVHYAEPRGRIVHDVLTALRHQRTLDTMGTRLRPNGEWYLKSARQMARRWQQHVDGLRATLAVAERCAFRMHELTPTLPAFPLPPGVTADEYLARLVEAGAAERIPGIREAAAAPPAGSARRRCASGSGGWRRLGERGLHPEFPSGAAASHSPLGRFPQAAPAEASLSAPPARASLYHAQIARELDVIRKLGLAGYFLIVWDIVRFSRREGILCQGRGSAANSVVCFCLGLTAVDPIKLGLLFERFLSEDREGAPDIDIDFAHRDRERVLQYVYERYGREHAAMVCEQITYRTKSAIRDAARVLGFSMEQADALSLRSDRFQEEEERPRPNAAPAPRSPFPLPPSDAVAASLDVGGRRVRALPAIVRGLRRIPRHRSIHVGGFVLTEEPLSHIVPIEPAAMDARTVIQWEKDDVEAMGLVKIDLLGLGMLTLIQDCLLYIRDTRGHTVDLAQLDYTDQAVYDDLCRADTIGVFQVESRAQMNTLPRLKPRCFYDLVVEVAIIRPGPIQGDMVHPYLRRRAGEEEVTYLHPSVKPILERTLGVPLFQEQGMQVAIAAAGFTPAEADALRRAMGHKRSHERMAAICERLIEGMRRHGIPEETARRIYNQINAFADYGFPESHAASFALLVFASAYLKHYYAPEFTAAILNAQPMGFYSPGTLIEDARRHGVPIRPVDAARSTFDCTLERDAATPIASPAVRLGFRLIKGLGSRSRDVLDTALRDGGPFQSIADFVRRSGLDRRALRTVAESGALDSFVPDEPDARRRRAAIWRMLETLRGEAGALAPNRPTLDVPASVAAMSTLELTAADYRLTGVSFHGHPLKHLRELLTPNGVRSAREVLALPDGSRDVAVAGLVICRQRPGTAKGFVFLTLEDETGLVNVVVTPQRFERQALLITTAPLLLVRGALQVEQRVVNLRGDTFRALRIDVGAEGIRSHDFR